MVYPENVIGYQCHDPNRWSEYQKGTWQLRPFEDHDVDVKIECCGVCASDLHCIKGFFGQQRYPLAPGHEIIGTVAKIGPKVTKFKLGQRVGVGAQVWSCMKCRACKNDNETYCPELVDTYSMKWPNTDIVLQGGYASHYRANEMWVFDIPEKLESIHAAPMLCAGITTYSPLVRNGCGPGKKVGIVGIGGLGHFGLMWAKALGAETWAISRTRAKEADVIKMGADGLLASDEPGWYKGHEMTFDLIINTASSFQGLDRKEYFGLLNVHGKWTAVGMPSRFDEAEWWKINNQYLTFPNGIFIGGSHLGSCREMTEMLQLAADKGIKPWVETIPISEGSLTTAMERLEDHDIHYRFCLVDYDKAFHQ